MSWSLVERQMMCGNKNILKGRHRGIKVLGDVLNKVFETSTSH